MTTLYRGGDIEALSRGVLSGEMRGYEATIYRGTLRDPNQPPPERRAAIGELEFTDPIDIPGESHYVIGGVTDELNATRRFRGTQGIVAVMDGDQLPFERIQYDYDFYDERPGVLEWVLTTAGGEYRDSRAGLWAVLNESPQADGTRILRVEHSKPHNLPATSPDSMFANEREFVALQETLDVSGALRGALSLTTTRSAGVARRSDESDVTDIIEDRSSVEWYHRRSRASVPSTVEPLYTFAVQNEPEQRVWTNDDIEHAVGPSGYINDVSTIPAEFRNGNWN